MTKIEHTAKKQIQGSGYLEEAIPGNRYLAPDPDTHLVLGKRLPNTRFGEQAGG